MVAKKSFNAAEMRRQFLERAWEILMKYLERLDEKQIIEATDARSGAGVVKTLLEAADRAEAGASAGEDEIDCPEIPETIIEEFVERLLEETVARPARKTGRPARPQVSPQASV